MAARLNFNSSHNLFDDSEDFVSAGQLILTDADAGPIDQDVTFVYNNVPIGIDWNIKTLLESRSNGAVSVLDFANTASFTNAALFVGNMPVDAAITGESGAIYSVPESASMALGLLTVIASRRRQS